MKIALIGDIIAALEDAQSKIENADPADEDDVLRCAYQEIADIIAGLKEVFK